MAPVAIGKDTFATTINDNGIVLVDFWASWCGPCMRFAPIYDAASERHPDVTFSKVDTEEERDLAAGLEISSIPTIMAFRDGMLVFRQAGMGRGDPGMIRTSDTRFRKPLLYPLSYRATRVLCDALPQD